MQEDKAQCEWPRLVTYKFCPDNGLRSCIKVCYQNENGMTSYYAIWVVDDIIVLFSASCNSSE